MASSIETTFEKAVSDGVIAGAVLYAATKDNGIVFSKSFGRRSLDKDAEPIAADDMMRLYSASKLITSIAALQVVERGLIGLDDDVSHILPEVGALKVLTGMNGSEPVFEERKGKITLRLLLSHSSGISYAFLSPLLQKYNQSQGEAPFPPFTTIKDSYSAPLVYQPGTAWEYSAAIDWAGAVVARLSGTSLEEFIQQNIAKPLEINDMTFFVNDKPNLKSRLVTPVLRDPSVPDGKGKVVPDNGSSGWLDAVSEELGGAGLATSMQSYIKVLHSILADDGKILKPETAEMMFKPQLTPASQKSLQSLFDHIPKGQSGGAPPFIGEFPQVKYDFGLGGMLSLEDVDAGSLTWRRKGYLFWSGMPNLFWFMDREAGVCGIFGTQVLPNADNQIRELIRTFEQVVYERFAFKA
ncbi:putative transesterase [Talaromyces proteolyticus]|uniref:Transesterase n=1 Tax=Talaromyces proteolyticus TaxID=1131652 RepID=A0AAD4KFM5_9EURO|nr:putative transesterase [Talaromyces proteolyticus]KAH8689159.1 putative transesterase [Talaromyces proteolyticus]